MVADQGKKAKLTERAPGDETDHIDTELVLNIEKLQEFQDDLDKVLWPVSLYLCYVCV